MSSVYEEIKRLETAKSKIEKAIETCGVNVPDDELIDTYASYISQIPQAVFSGLNAEKVGGPDKFIQSIEQENGVIKAEFGGLVSASNSGLVPQIILDTAKTITTSTDEWVLTSNNGSKPTWRKLSSSLSLKDYLPLSGGTMTGSIIINHDANSYAHIIYKNNRQSNDQTGGWADDIIRHTNALEDTITARIGVLGSKKDLSYLFLGHYDYSGINNLRIYNNHISTPQIQILSSTHPHIYGNGDILTLGGKNDQTKGSVVCDSTNNAFRRNSASANITLGTNTYRWGTFYGTQGNFTGKIVFPLNTGIYYTDSYGLLGVSSKGNWTGHPGNDNYYTFIGTPSYDTILRTKTALQIYRNSTLHTILDSGNYTTYINTTNFPGLNKTGTVTSVTVIGQNGLSGSGTVTTSGTITLSNIGVRSTTINGNYLRVNTNGENKDLTIPYATNASALTNKSVTDPANAANDNNKLALQWFSQINSNNSGTSGYAGTTAGFPVSNNANGILYLGTHDHQTTNCYFGGQLGVSSNGRLYYRFNNGNAWSTAANGGSWKTIAWTSDIKPVTNYYWANIKVSEDPSYYTTPQFGNTTINGIAKIKRINIYGPQVTDYSKGLYFLALDDSSRALLYYNGNMDDGLLGLQSNYSNIAIMPPSNKYVGIGTTSPTHKLHVAGSAKIGGNLLIGSNSNQNYIAFYGTTGDNPGSYNHTYIGENLWGGSESSELVLYKGNDVGTSATTVSGSGADRIRHIAGAHLFQIYKSALSGTFDNICKSPTPVNMLAIHQGSIETYAPLYVGGSLNVNGGSDLKLKASSSSNTDPGDLVFADSSGSELARLWKPSANDLYVRFGSSDPSKIILHSGNYNNILPVKLVNGLSYWDMISKGYLRNDYVDAKYPVEDYLKALCLQLINSYKGYACVGSIRPSTSGSYICYVYDVSINTTTGLPEYIVGTAFLFGGGQVSFGTVGGVWYYRAILNSSNYLNYTLPRLQSMSFTSNGTYVNATLVDSEVRKLAQDSGYIEFWDTAVSPNTQGWFNSKWGKVTAVNGFEGNLTGNATSASKWATPRTLTLTGSVTGSASIDGSTAVSLETTTNKLNITGFSNYGLSYYQTNSSFDGSSEGWAHYIISNHGDGASYYHYTIRLPFWGIPQYKRQQGSTSNVTEWFNFITSENISSQSVNYATSSGIARALGTDDSMKLYAQINNEINFGGTNSSDTIYFGYRAKDSKPIPTNFVFGGYDGSATLKANGFSKKESSDSYILLGGGGHKLISDFATSVHTHYYASSPSIGGAATWLYGKYTGSGGQQNPNYFGTNKIGGLMMNTKINNNSQYKDFLIMDCYSGNDVGGAVAFGINRQKLGAYIMRSEAARTEWKESAELLGTHNYNLYALPLTGGTVTGNIILKGNTTADMTYNGNVHPYIRFDNSNSSQNISLIFTDYDSYRSPAGIKLVGNQGNEWFEAPNFYGNKFIKNGSSDSYILLGGGGHKALSDCTIPAGTIVMWAGSSAPSGWLLCDGTSYKISDYLNLYNVIDMKYGGDSRNSTFKVPNLQQRFPLGAKAGGLNNGFNPRGEQLTAYTYLGDIGGDSQVKLSVETMPSHSHSVNMNLQVVKDRMAGAAAGAVRSFSTQGFSINNNGGNLEHSNMPPYLTVNFIIKY